MLWAVTTPQLTFATWTATAPQSILSLTHGSQYSSASWHRALTGREEITLRARMCSGPKTPQTYVLGEKCYHKRASDFYMNEAKNLDVHFSDGDCIRNFRRHPRWDQKLVLLCVCTSCNNVYGKLLAFIHHQPCHLEAKMAEVPE